MRLLYSILEAEDVETLFKLRPKFFEKSDWAVYEYAQTFYNTYGHLPTRSTIESHFSIELEETTEPVKVWWDDTIARWKKNVIDIGIIQAAKKGTDKEKIDLLQRALTAYSDFEEDSMVNIAEVNRLTIYEQNKATGGIHLSTGNTTFDEFSVGFGASDLWTLAGKEGQGKTWVILHMANWVDQIINEGKILFVSCEMDKDECAVRLDAVKTKLPYGKLIRGELTPIQEVRYRSYSNSLKTHIHMTDQVFDLHDLESLITIHRPRIVFVDGVHSLANSMDWKDMFTLTLNLKKMTRKFKVPIVITTHIQSDDDNNRLWSLAYSKGFSRNSDIVGVFFQNGLMEANNEIGIDWVKIRRGVRCQTIQKMEFDPTTFEVTDMRTKGELITSAVESLGDSLFGP